MKPKIITVLPASYLAQAVDVSPLNDRLDAPRYTGLRMRQALIIHTAPATNLPTLQGVKTPQASGFTSQCG